MAKGAPFDPRDVDLGAQAQVAGGVDLHDDLLADQGRMGAATEGQDLHARLALADAEDEPAGQLARLEIIGLVDDPHGVRCVGHPDAVNGEVAGDGIGREGRSLNAPNSVFSGKTVQERHPGNEGIVPHPQPHKAV